MEKSYVEIGNNYVITTSDFAHKLGRGAFADVYRCKKLVDGKMTPDIYAAKEIHFQRNIPNMEALIRKEIELMFQFTDENNFVVKIYDYFKSKRPGEMYIIMEYCEGGDLDKYVEENGPLTEHEIAELLFPVAESFAFIHSKGVVHRDLKLANLLLAKKLVRGHKPCIKITDFGLAHVMGQKQMTNTTCGTPLYMAPEIWIKNKEGYSNKIDVWAYGNMIYKMMYGEYVFEGTQVEKRVKEGIIRFPKLRLTSLEAMDLMLKCFRRDPNSRISFLEIVSHPFFSKKKFEIFDKVFDGYFGYFETTIDNNFNLLKDPNCLRISQEEPTAYDIHNMEVLKEWAKSEHSK
jgi:serine/threonine protein kinase